MRKHKADTLFRYRGYSQEIKGTEALLLEALMKRVELGRSVCPGDGAAYLHDFEGLPCLRAHSRPSHIILNYPDTRANLGDVINV